MENHKNTSGNWHNGNMTCCVKITAKHQAILFLHNYRPWSSEWCLARAEKDLRRPINALFWSQRFHFYDWIKYIPNQYNWWASVPMDEIVLMNMEKVGIPWIQTCLKDRWFSYMFFQGLGEVVVFFCWSCIQQQQGHKVCFPPVSPAEGKNPPLPWGRPGLIKSCEFQGSDSLWLCYEAGVQFREKRYDGGNVERLK